MKQLKYGLILNGPPGCGKDTIAAKFVETLRFRKLQFKDFLYAETARHFEVDLDKFIHFASDRSLKDSKSLAGLGGRTPREALIHISEDILKPRFGSDFIGKCEVARLESMPWDSNLPLYVVYPDGGFADEVNAVDSFYDVVIVCRLHRSGYDFSGDSRSYLYLPDTQKRLSFDVSLKEGEVQQAVSEISSIIEEAEQRYRKGLLGENDN